MTSSSSFTLILSFILTGLSANQSYAQKELISNPDRVSIHTEDIDLFWKVFDASQPKFSADQFNKDYLEKGSDGLKGFIPMRIQSGKHLKKTVYKNLEYYKNIRSTTLAIDGNKKILQGYFKKLKALYSPAVFPEIYFVIGAMNTGGTTFFVLLIIGAEMFGKANGNFSPRLPLEDMDLTVVHELIHYQQNYIHDQSLLAQSIREGTADFFCELVTGKHLNEAMYRYGDQHEKDLWEEFQRKMTENNWSPWLYGNKDDSRPRDLGYWMGYKIVKSYYEHAADKNQAIVDLLNISDFNKILSQSGYMGGAN